MLLGGAPRPRAALAAPQDPGSRTHLLIIAGVGGEPRFRDAFHQAAMSMADAASKRFALTDSSIVVLTEDPSRAPTRIAGRSTRENVEQAVARIATRARPGDDIVILLIGHGSQQSGEPRFNLPGPDLTAADFARLLARLGSRRVAFVNASSASGEFIKTLSAPNRVVVTATKSGFERNETHFPRFFVQAYAADGADTDKDGRVSILEAFAFARREVARVYESENRLQTEHALLDDNGDGVGSAEPDPRGGDGALARSVFLAGGAPPVGRATTNDPRLRTLYADKETLERRLDSLRLRKERTEAAAYERELEQLLVELARKNQAIREIERRSP
ncbi:MAG: hypothetical protein ACREON_18705 [Gemmatimonadaceae bacterium]